MTNFQTIALILAAGLILVTATSAARRLINRKAGLAWITLWIASGVAIARPSLTMRVARFLGIGRGADLVFYCAILAMFAGFFAVYLRFKRLDHQITLLVRNAAISAPIQPAGPSDRSEMKGAVGALASAAVDQLPKDPQHDLRRHEQ